MSKPESEGKARAVRCWTTRQEFIAKMHGYLSEPYLAAFKEPSATCMLADGHASPHTFTPDDEVTFVFAKESPDGR